MDKYQENYKNDLENQIEVLKNRDRKLKAVSAGCLAALAIFSAGLVYHLSNGVPKNDSLNKEIETFVVDEIMQSEEFEQYVEQKEIELYNEYKSGNISAAQYREALKEIYDRQYIIDNADKIVSEEQAEELEQLDDEQSKNMKRNFFPSLLNSVAGIISLGVGIVNHCNIGINDYHMEDRKRILESLQSNEEEMSC